MCAFISLRFTSSSGGSSVTFPADNFLCGPFRTPLSISVGSKHPSLCLYLPGIATVCLRSDFDCYSPFHPSRRGQVKASKHESAAIILSWPELHFGPPHLFHAQLSLFSSVQGPAAQRTIIAITYSKIPCHIQGLLKAACCPRVSQTHPGLYSWLVHAPGTQRAASVTTLVQLRPLSLAQRPAFELLAVKYLVACV